MTWDDAVSFALSLPGTERGDSYGGLAVLVSSNSRSFLFRGREDDTSFGLALDLDTIEVLKATAPGTFWQTPQCEGWSGVLVRYHSNEDELVRDMICLSREWTASRPPARVRLRNERLD